MAFMNKMRDSMPVVFAGLAGIFLLMIVFEWGGQGQLFKGSTFDGESIGVVNGRKISMKEYDQTVNLVTENQKNQQKKTDLTEAEMAQVRDQAWDDLVTRALIRNSAEKLGMWVTDQEIRDQLYDNPPEYVKRQFTDSVGVFHQKEYLAEIRNPKNDSVVRKELIDPMREQLLFQKWQNFISATVRVTDAELWERYNNNTAKANLQVIKVLPTSSPREFLPKVADADIKTYYDAHLSQYKREESRKVKFVIFQEVASPKDSIKTMERLASIQSRLAAVSADLADTTARDLTAENSDAPYQPAKMMTAQEWGSSPTAAKLENAKPGETFITQTPTQGTVSRVVAVEDTGATYFHARHILIGFGKPENKDSAKAVAAKVIQELKAGADFAATAKKYSTDPSSAKNGGDLKWVGPKQFVKEFEAVAMTAKLNEILPPVESQFGIHIIEVLGRTKRQLKVVNVPVDIKPSSETVRMLGQQATIFRAQAAKQGFDQAAKAAGYRVITEAPAIEKKGQALFGSKDFTEWAFDASKGDISQVVKVPAARMQVVAQLTDITPAGSKPLEDVKEQIRSELAKRLRVESMAGKAKELRNMLQPGDDLFKIATVDSMYKPITVSMGPAESVGGLGTEYAVNIAAYKMKPGEISQPIKGDNGYYIIKLLSFTPASKEQFEAQKSGLLSTLLKEKQQRFIQGWIDAEKANAKITDFRSKAR
jgi:peptidyl-prolyl cis-trans isomerase D